MISIKSQLFLRAPSGQSQYCSQVWNIPPFDIWTKKGGLTASMKLINQLWDLQNLPIHSVQ